MIRVPRVTRRGPGEVEARGYTNDDDFGAPKTAFLVCSFWYIDALAAIGSRDEARALFIDLLARRNAFGLLSEDIHPETGTL
jgi:GH15 family glucan-1,4-alpha-glucosidase